MATGEEWMEHFKKVSSSKKAGLKKAMKVLESDPMIKKEYKWTGIFKLDMFFR